MPPAKRTRGNLTPGDWARAALDAMALGGLAAVAIEPLATQLGTTKGSFYWHLRDRAALVDATLELWVQQDTEAVIAALDEVPDPLDKMRALFAYTHPADRSFALEAVMLAESNDPQVGPVLLRVTRRRVDYIAGTLGLLGIAQAEARYRALLAYQMWIGYVQLHRAVGAVMPRGKARDAYLQHIVATLEAGIDP